MNLVKSQIPASYCVRLHPLVYLKFVWRQSGFAFFSALTSVGALFYFAEIKKHIEFFWRGVHKLVPQNQIERMLFVILFIGILGAVIGAVVAELTVGWTYVVGWGVDGHHVFNPAAIIFVVLGLIIGILIGCFVKRLLSAIKENKSSQHYSNADEINKLKNLLDSGAITQEEFDEKKKQLLNL